MDLAELGLEDGDTINICGDRRWLARVICWITRKKYSHSGLALWYGDRWWLSELNGGHNHLTDLAQWENFDVFARPREVSGPAIREQILSSLAVRIAYGVLSFLVIGLLELLGIHFFIHWRQILVCSSLNVKLYVRCGWPDRTFLVSPGRLAEQLHFKFGVRRVAA